MAFKSKQNTAAMQKAVEQSQKEVMHKLTLYVPMEIFDKVKLKALINKRTLSDIYTEFSKEYIK